VTPLVGLLAMVLTWAALVFVGFGPCGGDGGNPRAVPGSAQANLCEAVFSGRQWMVLTLVPLVILAVWAAVCAEPEGFRFRLLGYAATIGWALAIYPFFALLPGS
jgi:hypothetical protein